MIRFEDTTVSFIRDGKDFIAVDKANLEIKKGEFFGIVGSSGAGKSTLVRTVNLLQKPTSGKVFVDGKDVTDLTGNDLSALRLKIGMIFQHFNLVKNATVFDNVAFALKASNTPKAEIGGRVLELLDLVGLKDRAHVYPNSLSGGQKQRVAIARALANNPEILLCDEATSALDPDNTKEVVQTLKNIKSKYPITVLFITHQMEVAKSLFDRVAVMSQGKVVEVNSCYDVFAHPESQAARNLINKSFEGVIPKEVIEHEHNLYLITFKEENAYDPVISYVSRNYPLVDLSIIAGNIEYIQQKPLGRLLISLRGTDEGDINSALEYLKQKAFVHKFDREVIANA
ncbi:MAG: ATP-binding cassette domain-containing protein [Succinivibrio sp.]|nr:ATP-binding cassette domain-containing protein [Succinivibrio sp.]MDY5189240.1 ATP-binding cassette domain-containing protein [Succinivibrio sp.]